MEYKNECLNLKIKTISSSSTIEIVDLNTDTSQEYSLLDEDFELISQEMRVPGFGWGNILIKIGRAIQKALTGE